MSITNYYVDIIEKIADTDARYSANAYLFVQESVTYTVNSVSKTYKRKNFHISGQELLEGIKCNALEQYGPMAYDLLNDWGVKCTEDFGNIVFTMIAHNLLSARDEDTISDFRDGFDFQEEFVGRFQPKGKKTECPLIA